ncbi:hypothetical protein [Mycobacteroides salmoniphilum]|uniref:hypothetical protein n=1 Tax=Mycobacteroides salmoniphilum TaxID=404941 RepID=UPI0009944742|nr:hypothetical protein [Mycobacteroides salmoniphilum]
MFEFLKKIFQKPNPAQPESIQGQPVREIHELDAIWVDTMVHGKAYVVVRTDSVVPQETPPWMYQDVLAGHL